MSLNRATYKGIRRDVFNAVADRILADEKLHVQVTVSYDGTELYGNVTIDGGASEEFKKALMIFNEEYCK